MLDTFTGSVPTDVYPPPPDQRADSLGIKQHIAELMTEEDGAAYWTSLVCFLKGRIDRNEFEAETQRLLNSDKLVGLHNALVLSILYNTTRPEPPQDNPSNRPNLHTTGQGWHKRRRISPVPTPTPAKVKVKLAETDPKKRKLKEAIMALSQRERNRLKQIALKREKDKEHGLKSGAPTSTNLSKPPKYACREKTENVMNTPLSSKMKISSSTLYQDYIKCQQAPLCSEAKQLPDFDTLKDRMCLAAYDSGLINGVDNAAASLALIALEVHLKTLLGDLLSLIRSDRSVVNAVGTDLETSSPVLQSSYSDPTHSSDPLSQPPQASTSSQPMRAFDNQTQTPSCEQTARLLPPALTTTPSSAYHTTSTLRLRDLKTQGLAPHLTPRDFAALAEISPHAFVRSHPGALERLISTQNCSEPSSSDDEDLDQGEDTNLPDRIDIRTGPDLEGRSWMTGPHPSALSMAGSSSSTGRTHPRSGRSSQINKTSSSQLARVKSFSPRSVNKTGSRGPLNRHHASTSNPFLPGRSLLDGFQNTKNLPNMNGQSSPFWVDTGSSRLTVNVSKQPNHYSSSGLRPPQYARPNATADIASDPSSQGPLLTFRNSINGMHGLNHSPVLEEHSVIRPDRRPSSAHPVKSLAAELFPEDDLMAQNPSQQKLKVNGNCHSNQFQPNESQHKKESHLGRDEASGSESENEEDEHMAADNPRTIRMTNGKHGLGKNEEPIPNSPQLDGFGDRSLSNGSKHSVKVNGVNRFVNNLSPQTNSTSNNNNKKKGWERIDTFRLLEHVGN